MVCSRGALYKGIVRAIIHPIDNNHTYIYDIILLNNQSGHGWLRMNEDNLKLITIPKPKYLKNNE